MRVLLFNPLFWITLFVGISLFLKKSRIKSVLRNTGIIIFLLSTNVCVSGFFYSNLEYKTILVADISTPYDIGIVLGPFLLQGTNHPNVEEIITAQHARFFHASQLYKTGKIKKMLLSGNNDAELARSYLISIGIPAEDILLESKSKDTYENALFTKQFLNQKGIASIKLLLITSAFHMRRAKKCFDKVGLDVTPFSVDYARTGKNVNFPFTIVPSSDALKSWNRIFTEWASMLYFKYKHDL